MIVPSCSSGRLLGHTTIAAVGRFKLHSHIVVTAWGCWPRLGRIESSAKLNLDDSRPTRIFATDVGFLNQTINGIVFSKIVELSRMKTLGKSGLGSVITRREMRDICSPILNLVNKFDICKF